jgi:hypothetical protein
VAIVPNPQSRETNFVEMPTLFESASPTPVRSGKTQNQIFSSNVKKHANRPSSSSGSSTFPVLQGGEQAILPSHTADLDLMGSPLESCQLPPLRRHASVVLPSG